MQTINPTLRWTLVLVGSAAYIGLAVLGWGGFGPFFSHPALLALALVQAVIAVAAGFAGGNLSQGIKEDRRNRWVLPALGVIGLLQAYVPAWTDRHEIWCLDGDALRWVGVVVFAVGAAFRLWPVFVLGDRFSGLVAIQPGHTLVTVGIYSSIRHPSYLGLLLYALGWSLAFRSGVSLVLTVLLLPPLLGRINAEERLLHDQFGDEYEAYRTRTSRLIPGIY